MFEIEEAYHKGYEQGYEDCEKAKRNDWIEIGRNEAWKAVKKLYLSVDNGGLPGDDVRKIFGNISWIEIVRNFSASEVIKKLCIYEEKKKMESEFCIGDEVQNNNGIKRVVVGSFKTPDGNEFISIMDTDFKVPQKCLKKIIKRLADIFQKL